MEHKAFILGIRRGPYNEIHFRGACDCKWISLSIIDDAGQAMAIAEEHLRVIQEENKS